MRNSSSALLLCAAVLAGCGGQTGRSEPSPTPKPVRTASPAPTIAPVTVRAERRGNKQVSIVVAGHGKTFYRILADSNDSRRASSGTYTSHFTNPSIVFFDHDGGQMRATARTADADGASKIVTLHDAVHIVTADGSVLTCDHFSYDQALDRVHGWGNVDVHTKQGDTLHGSELTGNTTLRSVHIDG